MLEYEISRYDRTHYDSRDPQSFLLPKGSMGPSAPAGFQLNTIYLAPVDKIYPWHRVSLYGL
jgi:hypothetical protein